MISRQKDHYILNQFLDRYPVVGIVGARQVGKTTLARSFSESLRQKVHYFDLENPEDLSKLNDPMLALKSLKGLVIIDEIQRLPELFPILRVLSDRPQSEASFLILGSASPELLRHGSESLAGRVHYHKLNGFALDEVGVENKDLLWLRGGFPRAYLSDSDLSSDEWRQDFIRTFLERDLPQLGINIRSMTLHRFWRMVAHYHGQIWNASEFARSFGVADTTIRNYLDILTSALILFQLLPWHENIKKRQVKAPKVYIADTGLLHSLLNLQAMNDLEGHPKLGASWEWFVITQLIRQLGVRPDECYFWATHSGAELDLLIIKGQQRLGFEIKRTSSPRVTPSMRNALTDLKLKRIDVIHAGNDTYMLQENIRAVALLRIFEDIQPLVSF